MPPKQEREEKPECPITNTQAPSEADRHSGAGEGVLEGDGLRSRVFWRADAKSRRSSKDGGLQKDSTRRDPSSRSYAEALPRSPGGFAQTVRSFNLRGYNLISVSIGAPERMTRPQPRLFALSVARRKRFEKIET